MTSQNIDLATEIKNCTNCKTPAHICIDEIERKDKNVLNKEWIDHHYERMNNGCDRYTK